MTFEAIAIVENGDDTRPKQVIGTVTGDRYKSRGLVPACMYLDDIDEQPIPHAVVTPSGSWYPREATRHEDDWKGFVGELLERHPTALVVMFGNP